MKNLLKLGIGVVLALCTGASTLRAATLDELAVRTMSGTSDAHRARVVAAARVVAESEAPLWTSVGSVERTAGFLVVFTGRESGGNETVNGDGGEAWGAMQIHWRLWGPLLEQWGTIGSVYDLYDMEMSMRSALAVMKFLASRCGSVKHAAYAYASGTCKGNAFARSKIDARCAMIGGC